MTEELKMYYDWVSTKNIAKHFGVSEIKMGNRLHRHRKKYNKPVRGGHANNPNIVDFIKDKKIIMELFNDGMPRSTIASKYSINERSCGDYINKWRREPAPMNIDDLMLDWRSITGEKVIVCDGEPVFKVVML